MQLELSKDSFSRRQFITLSACGVSALAIPGHFRTIIKERIVYSQRQSDENLLVNVGDSIARGGSKNDPLSPADLITEEVISTGRNWKVLNLAQVGVTTREVIKHQLLDPKLKKLIDDNKTVDVDFIVHTGANDIGKSFAGDEGKITRIKEQLANLDINAVRNALIELGEATANFREDFKDFLEAADILFGRKIRHLIVISPPDFSLAPRINSFTNGKTHSFQLDNPAIQFLVKEGCRELRRNIAESVRRSSPFPYLMVPTEGIDRSHFDGDQHLNREGNLIIARNFLSRVIFT